MSVIPRGWSRVSAFDLQDVSRPDNMTPTTALSYQSTEPRRFMGGLILAMYGRRTQNSNVPSVQYNHQRQNIYRFSNDPRPGTGY